MKERKCHVSMDVDSCTVKEWIVTRGNIHDSRISHDLIDSVRNYTHILADSAYDTSEIYDYIFDNTHSMLVIDTSKRIGIRSDRLPMNRNIGIDLRKKYSSLYSLRWEIERTFSILEEMLHCENIWYTHNRSYDHAISFKIIVCNLIVISNILSGKRPKKIKMIASC